VSVNKPLDVIVKLSGRFYTGNLNLSTQLHSLHFIFVGQLLLLLLTFKRLNDLFTSGLYIILAIHNDSQLKSNYLLKIIMYALM